MSLDDWQTESLRLSAFVAEPHDSASASFWEPLVGAEPEAVHRMPRDRKTKEEGPFLDGNLSVEASDIRIDWRFGQDPKSPIKELPVVGSYSRIHSEFRELMTDWLVHCPTTHRLAYGAVLLVPVRDVSEGNQLLNNLLPTVDIDPGMSDFLYRVNRRRAARSLAGLAINRLSTWSVLSIVDIRLNLPLLEQGVSPVAQTGDRSVCRLELDINTAPEFGGEMDHSVASEVFLELVDLGNEIASMGDVG
jgi:hypothetical protein